MAIPGELIPLMAIGVALVAVAGKVIVQPIIQAVLRMSEQQRAVPAADTSRLEQRLAALEDRLAGMEGSMDRLLADRDFYLQLQAGRAAQGAASPPAPPPPPAG